MFLLAFGEMRKRGRKSVSLPCLHIYIYISHGISRCAYVYALLKIMYSAFAGERPSRFYLVREEADLSLDSSTGMLRIRQPLDRESRDKYVLSVEARNGGIVGYCQVNWVHPLG